MESTAIKRNPGPGLDPRVGTAPVRAAVGLSGANVMDWSPLAAMSEKPPICLYYQVSPGTLAMLFPAGCLGRLPGAPAGPESPWQRRFQASGRGSTCPRLLNPRIRRLRRTRQNPDPDPERLR